jgi:hypothetical protein
MEKFKLKKSISLATAQRWMKKLGYRWTMILTGQYIDGHEHINVMNYRQKVFLPLWMSIEEQTRRWTADFANEDGEWPCNRRTVVWFHDESTFYANDQWKLHWVHKDEKAIPCAKGEGASLMVADFVSANYGWLRSPDKTKEARVIFKAGINCEGYFMNEDILKQATMAMDILKEHYPDDDHDLVLHSQRVICQKAPRQSVHSGGLTYLYLIVMESRYISTVRQESLQESCSKRRFQWIMHSSKMAHHNSCTTQITMLHIQAASRAWLSFSKSTG